MKLPISAFAAAALLALPNTALISALAAQESPPQESVAPSSEVDWYFEESDLPVDEGFTFGKLDNGMRYILRQNATPEGTAVIRMRIDSGSLVETEEERGLAHYLEHMAFNGSTNIPEGEMVSLLEREGLAFGRDTNASTGLNAITYMLNLPRNDDELLATSLMIMRETASELTLSEEAVERERGVILAEERDRRNFSQRAQEDSFEFTAPGARFAQRLPIGTVEVIQGATSAQLRALYERTYTPSNTVLVIVGDYPVDVMEAAIKERFSDWSGGPVPEEPITGPVDITRTGLTDIYLDPALSESVQVSALGAYIDEPDTLANRDLQGLRFVGYNIINRRLARLAREADAPFRSAGFGTGSIFEDARTTSLSISSVDGEWKKGLTAAVQVVNEALTYGFTQAEIDEQLANSRTTLENRVRAADTRSNGAFVGAALGLISDDRVPTTPQFSLENFERSVSGITPQRVHQAILDHIIPLDDPLIRFQGRTAPEGGETALRAAYSEGMALAIAPPEDTGLVQFAYTDFGTPGKIVSDTNDERLGFRYITFANGVRLTLKQTDIREDRIAFEVAVDGGSLMNTSENPLRTRLISSLPSGGLGQHSADELQTVLAGRSVSLRVTNSADAFTFAGATTPRDLELQMQIIAAAMTDPGYRQEGIEIFRRGIDNFFKTLRATPGRAYSTVAGAILSDNDPRFSLQSRETYFSLDFEQLREAVSDRLANGAIEIALVGDLDQDAAIGAVAATLGALPAREVEFNMREEARIRTFTSTRGERVLRHEGEPDVAQVRVIWPTTDDNDLQEAMKVSLLSRIVQIELIDRLREELGQTYSPGASSSMSRIYRDYGTLSILASVEVGEVEPTRAAIRSLVEDLRSAPIDADTIERAREPLLESYDNALKSLGGWMNLADRAQSQNDRLDRWFAGPDTLKAITGEDLQEVALRYLDPDDAVVFLVLPEEPSESDESAEADTIAE